MKRFLPILVSFLIVLAGCSSGTGSGSFQKRYGNLKEEIEQAWEQGDVSALKAYSALIEEQQKVDRMRFWALVLLFTAILATLFWYFRVMKIQAERKLKEEKAEAEKYMEIAEDLQTKLQAASRRLPSEKHLSIAKFDVLERLCEQYYVYEGTENLQPKILKEVKDVIGELRSDSSRKGLELMLDRNKDNVVSRLREQLPDLSEDNIRLFTYAPPYPPSWKKTRASSITGSGALRTGLRIHRRQTRISLSNVSTGSGYSCLSRLLIFTFLSMIERSSEMGTLSWVMLSRSRMVTVLSLRES